MRLSKRKDGLAVSQEDIQIAAKVLWIEKYSEIHEGVTFSASNGWLYRFLKRHGFTERRATSIGQKIPSHGKQLALNYFTWINTHCKDIPSENIGAMDESPMQIEMPIIIILIFTFLKCQL